LLHLTNGFISLWNKINFPMTADLTLLVSALLAKAAHHFLFTYVNKLITIGELLSETS
jgi:hypothetical protein